IELLETDLKAGLAKAEENLETLEKAYFNPTQLNLRNFKAKVLEALQSAVSRTRRGKYPPRQGRKVKSASKPVVFSNSKIHEESPMPQNC
ncbi:MAG: hypothetical protein QNJ33_19770, partial [Crocosphaera sp.]|nr:hypothetical protein [Crocosphaera sp.]